MVPSVYFFFPETTSRSLEEMDHIFHKTTNVFNVVSVARSEPHMYGPNGELLRTLDDVEDEAVRRTLQKQGRQTHHENVEKDSDGTTSEDK